MSWFNRRRKIKKSKKRSAILKRRGPSAERLIFWAKRFGLTIATILFIGWLGAWFFMSDTNERLAAWAHNKTMVITANYGFEVKNIMVEGREYTDADVIMAIIGLEKNDPIFLFHPDEARDMMEKISWVKSARVERRLPDTIYINLTERTPMALWQRNQRLSLIDTEGVILTDDKLARFKNYLIVAGEDVPSKAPNFLKLLSAEPLIVQNIDAAKLVSNRRWDLVTKKEAIVKLPEDDLALSLRRLATMHEDEGILDKDVKIIDARESTRITVRTKPGAVQEYKTNSNKAGHQKASSAGGAI